MRGAGGEAEGGEVGGVGGEEGCGFVLGFRGGGGGDGGGFVEGGGEVSALGAEGGGAGVGEEG